MGPNRTGCFGTELWIADTSLQEKITSVEDIILEAAIKMCRTAESCRNQMLVMAESDEKQINKTDIAKSRGSYKFRPNKGSKKGVRIILL